MDFNNIKEIGKFERGFSSENVRETTERTNNTFRQGKIEASLPELKITGSANFKGSSLSHDGSSEFSWELQGDFKYEGWDNDLTGSFTASAEYAKKFDENHSIGLTGSLQGNLEEQSVLVKGTYRYDDNKYTTTGKQLVSFETTATTGQTFGGDAMRSITGEGRYGNDLRNIWGEVTHTVTGGKTENTFAVGQGREVDLPILGKANLDIGVNHNDASHSTNAVIGISVPTR